MKEFNQYQEWTRETGKTPKNIRERYAYLALGLSGESGEVAERIKKFIRGDDGTEFTEKRREDIKKELGDVLWYLARLSDELNIPLQDVAQLNHDKCVSRKARGKLSGDGDNR